MIAENRNNKSLRAFESRELNNVLKSAYEIAFKESKKYGLRREDSEDIAQKVTIKIWQSLDRYNPNLASFYTWAKSITKNTVISHFRKRRLDNLTNLDLDIIDERKSELDRDKLEIWDYLDYLPKKQQEIINFIYGKGKTISEISENLEIPKGTIKSRLNRALETLRDLMPSKLESELSY